MPGDERAGQQEPARAGMLIGAVVAEPGDLRADVAGIQVASAQLPKAMRVHPFSRLIALSLRPSIHPDQGGAHRLSPGVGRNQLKTPRLLTNEDWRRFLESAVLAAAD